MRIAAGILTIVGGLGIVPWLTLAFALLLQLLLTYPEWVFIWRLLGVLSYAPIVIAFIGSYFTFKRKRWKLSLAGAICSVIGYPFIPGILAVVFLVKRKNEFQA